MTPSMAELASRVSGMVAGSMRLGLRLPFGGDGLGQRARGQARAPSWPACASACRRAGCGTARLSPPAGRGEGGWNLALGPLAAGPASQGAGTTQQRSPPCRSVGTSRCRASDRRPLVRHTRLPHRQLRIDSCDQGVASCATACGAGQHQPLGLVIAPGDADRADAGAACHLDVVGRCRRPSRVEAGSAPVSAMALRIIEGCGLEGWSSAVWMVTKCCCQPSRSSRRATPRRDLPVAMPSRTSSRPARAATTSPMPGYSGSCTAAAWRLPGKSVR